VVGWNVHERSDFPNDYRMIGRSDGKFAGGAMQLTDEMKQHGGRPIWMQTAFFLLRRHKNVHLDISGIPPKILLKYFPRLEEISHKTLFGTDWPSPGIPDIKQNLEQFQALALPDAVKEQILSRTALDIWPT